MIKLETETLQLASDLWPLPRIAEALKLRSKLQATWTFNAASRSGLGLIVDRAETRAFQQTQKRRGRSGIISPMKEVKGILQA